MENQSSQIQPVTLKVDETPKDLGHGPLLDAMYFLWDAFSRANMDFFPINDTFKNMDTQHMLEGDHIDVAIRQQLWNSDDKELIFIYLRDENIDLENVDEHTLKLVYKDVPIYIHIVKDTEGNTNLVGFSYEHEMWKKPSA